MKCAGVVYLLSVVLALGMMSCSKSNNPTGPSGSATISVSGSVLDAAGIPISGRAVIVPGKTPVVTDAGGTFTIAGVSTPYDIYLVDQTGKSVIIYVGLTKASPVFKLDEGPNSTKFATVSGSVPVVSGRQSLLVLTRNGKVVGTTSDGGGGSYSTSVAWNDTATTISVTIHLFRFTSDSGHYEGYTTKAFSVAQNATSSANNFSTGDVAAIQDTTLTGMVVPPNSLTLGETVVRLKTGNDLISLAVTNQSPFTFHVPVIPGATLDLVGNAQNGGTGASSSAAMGGIASGASNINLTLTGPPQLALPPNNATNVDTSTTFAWNQTASGIFRFKATPAGNAVSVTVYTSALTLQIPNLSQAGVSLPANMTYTWNVVQYSASSVDDVASASFFDLENGKLADFSEATSARSSFTTKP